MYNLEAGIRVFLLEQVYENLKGLLLQWKYSQSFFQNWLEVNLYKKGC